MSGQLRTFEVIGRGGATAANPKPQLFKMKLFAQNEVIAKSRFWYFLSQIKKVKKGSGEVLSVSEIHEKKPLTVKNYGLFLRYDSRSGTHNMYKEFRDTTLNGAINKLYLDMAGRHRARKRSVQVIKAEPIPASACKRGSTRIFHDDGIKFPLPRVIAKPTHKRFKAVFGTSRPVTHKSGKTSSK
eukprot:c3771_g1_i1.p1 GENE.c3771_g1_i1~~c3771_g1_i1.p1  ORF type:complete len:185 (-),score=28.23 c3771_g1_i1:59-613(-)